MRAATRRHRLRGGEGQGWGFRSNSSVATFNGDSETVLRFLFGHVSRDTFTSAIKQNPFIMAAWKSISRNLSGIPIRVYKGDRMNRKPSDWVGAQHPLQMLMDKPAPGQIRSTFWANVTAHKLQSGESIWMILGQDMKPRRSKTETPAGLWPLVPNGTQPVIEPGQILPRKYVSTFAGRPIELLDHQIVRIFEPDPDDTTGYRALSPLMAGWVDLKADFAAGRWNEDFFDNGAMPNGILKSKSRLIASKAKQMREAWEDQHGGVGKAHRTAILDDGTDYQPLGQTAKDMEFLNMRNWSITVASAITGVPKKELALTEDMNHATALSMDRQYWTRTLIPEIRAYEDFMWCDVFRFIEGGKYYVAWDLSAVPALREDMESQLNHLGKMQLLGIRPKDARAAVGLDLPSQGEADEIQTLPANLITVEDMLSSVEEPPMDSEVVAGDAPADGEDPEDPEDEGADAEDAPSDGEATDEETAGEESAPKRQSLSPSSSVRGRTSRERLKTAADKSRAKKASRAKRARQSFKRFDEQVRRKSSKTMTAKVSRWMNKMRKGIVQRAEEIAKSQGFERKVEGGTFTRALGSKLIEWRLSEADIDAILGDVRAWEDALNGLTRSTFDTIIKRVGGHLAEELGTPFTIDLADPKWTEIISKARARLVKNVPDETRKSVRDRLLEVARAGGNVLDVQKSMQEMSEFGRDRANRIAWTETSMTAGDARYQGIQEAGTGRHQWLDDGGPNVRDAHRAISGEIVKVGEPFSNGMLYPLGPLADGSVAPAEEVVNCNCFAVAVLD